MTSPLLASLNREQAAAVAAPDGHALILAGAGSGKTRVLTHRIAWLMQEQHVRPTQIMAVTFTNKAAAEMRKRLESLCPYAAGLWVSTFHGLAHRLLRLHFMEANLPEAFQVLDADDQLKLVRQIVRDMKLDEELYAPREVANWITKQKDLGKTPATVSMANSVEQTYAEVFTEYQKRCEIGGLVDFAEMLNRSVQMLLNTPVLLSHYQHRFLNILVDEFQDTNAIQYQFISLLAGGGAKVFIVGDDDQSIYGWRGAQVENMQAFLQDYPGAVMYKLEQNYRSTETILGAANELIGKNPDRLGKSLWTQSGAGELIDLRECASEVDEAKYVVEKIQRWKERGGDWDQCAVLYRSNAQSRAFEEQLMAKHIPYRIYGGLKFFERAEIKDAMAYLRLVASPQDDSSFERVVNLPARGLGDKSLQKIRDIARAQSCSLFSAAEQACQKKLIGGKAGMALQDFLEGLRRFKSEHRQLPLPKVFELVLTWSGLREHHQKASKADKDPMGRVMNLEELVSVAARFTPPVEEGLSGMSPLVAFLSHAALEAGERGTGAHENQPSVQLMTLHSAKGLEFPLVCLAGLEHGLFPNQRAVLEDGRLDEERRLAYVGITRAMKKLVITHARERRLYGQRVPCAPSLFLQEIPSKFLNRSRSPVPAPAPQGQWRQNVSSDDDWLTA